MRACTAPRRAALSVATEAGNPSHQARAHDGLAKVSRELGDLGPARRHWQEALTRLKELGVPQAAEVRARLASLNHG
jgi:hypothetical protein